MEVYYCQPFDYCSVWSGVTYSSAEENPQSFVLPLVVMSPKRTIRACINGTTGCSRTFVDGPQRSILSLHPRYDDSTHISAVQITSHYPLRTKQTIREASASATR